MATQAASSSWFLIAHLEHRPANRALDAWQNRHVGDRLDRWQQCCSHAEACFDDSEALLAPRAHKPAGLVRLAVLGLLDCCDEVCLSDLGAAGTAG
jgi:hypothetical protein